MKKVLSFSFLLVICLHSFCANAQKPVFNHLAVYVTSLQKSTAFYKDVVGLDTIPEPFHDGRHTWFAIGLNSHLHVIAGAVSPTPHVKDNHMCFSVPSVDAFVARLTKANVLYEDVTGKPQSIMLRADGVKQIYFKDPDGYWIEINDATR